MSTFTSRGILSSVLGRDNRLQYDFLCPHCRYYLELKALPGAKFSASCPSVRYKNLWRRLLLGQPTCYSVKVERDGSSATIEFAPRDE